MFFFYLDIINELLWDTVEFWFKLNESNALIYVIIIRFIQRETAKSSAGRAKSRGSTTVMEVEFHYFCGRGSTTAVAVKFFINFLNEFGNAKLFELYLIFYCLHRGTTTATEVVQFYFCHWGTTAVLPADDLAERFEHHEASSNLGNY